MYTMHHTTGVVLKREDHREADRVYVYFSRELGKIRLLGRGARKTKAKVAPHLESFSVIRAMLVEGKGGFTVVSSDIDSSYHQFTNRADQMHLNLAALHFMDLGTRFESPDPSLFDLLVSWKQFVSEIPQVSSGRSAILLGSFVLRLASLVGYEPELSLCVETRQPVEEGSFLWSAARGGVVLRSVAEDPERPWARARAIEDETLKLLRLAQNGGWKTLLQTTVSGRVFEEFCYVIDSYLLAHFPVIPLVSIKAMTEVDSAPSFS